MSSIRDSAEPSFWQYRLWCTSIWLSFKDYDQGVTKILTGKQNTSIINNYNRIDSKNFHGFEVHNISKKIFLILLDKIVTFDNAYLDIIFLCYTCQHSNIEKLMLLPMYIWCYPIFCLSSIETSPCQILIFFKNKERGIIFLF